ncbi:MAG: glutathione S-transferase family protein [Myxococcota bacterium]
MKLYMFPVAPNPTRVRLYLAEKAEAGCPVELDEVLVNLPAGEQKRPEHLARNSFGALPVLELEDGTHLSESLAIIEYLEELHPDPPMIGATPLERARVRELERIAEIGVLHRVAGIVHAVRSPLGWAPNPGAASHFQDRLPAALEVLDGALADGRPFVAGARPTVADCTLQAALQFARFGEVEIDAGLEHLARWDREYRERPPARAVLIR